MVQLKFSSSDPLLPQLVCQSLFEDMIKSKFSSQKEQGLRKTSQTRVLSKDEQNVLRYASGYVAMSLLRHYKEQHGSKAASFVECLSHMAIDGPEDSFLDYTKEWIHKVNRGGLFEVNNGAYMLFESIELASCEKLKEHLEGQQTALNLSCTDKRSIIDFVVSDTDVKFNWSMVSVDIEDENDCEELLHKITEKWLTIRGFSIASAIVEQYKRITKTNNSKSTSLRKGLQKAMM